MILTPSYFITKSGVSRVQYEDISPRDRSKLLRLKVDLLDDNDNAFKSGIVEYSTKFLGVFSEKYDEKWLRFYTVRCIAFKISANTSDSADFYWASGSLGAFVSSSQMSDDELEIAIFERVHRYFRKTPTQSLDVLDLQVSIDADPRKIKNRIEALSQHGHIKLAEDGSDTLQYEAGSFKRMEENLLASARSPKRERVAALITTKKKESMIRRSMVLSVLIGAPSDCSEELAAIREVIDEWNSTHGMQKPLFLNPVNWETHARSEIGDRPQSIINRQLTDECDLLVAAFWTRLGTPTGKEASGTVEEISRFLDTGKKVLLYFSAKPIDPAKIDPEQYEKVKDFKESMRKSGIVFDCKSIGDLKDRFRKDLHSHLAQLLGEYDAELTGGSDSEADTNVKNLREFRRQLAQLIKRLRNDWEIKRTSEIPKIDEAKFVLSGAYDEMLGWLELINEDNTGVVSNLLKEVAKEFNDLQDMEMFLGRKSFDEFWDRGEAAFGKLEKVVAALDEMLSDD